LGIGLVRGAAGRRPCSSCWYQPRLPGAITVTFKRSWRLVGALLFLAIIWAVRRYKGQGLTTQNVGGVERSEPTISLSRIWWGSLRRPTLLSGTGS